MNKTAIVTGAAGGIGAAIVTELVKQGYKVTAMVHSKTASSENPEFLRYVQGDVSNKEDRKRLVDEAIHFGGNIGTLVNVAGVAPAVRTDLLDMTEESYDRVMSINTKGMLFLSQLVARHMVEQAQPGEANGTIVNISSLSAYTSSTSRGEYCISKAGVSMITKLFADRLSEFNITVNEIRPGIIETPMTDTVKEKYDKLIDGGLLPIARWGQPEDIAKAVYALCSGQFPYTTGQSIDVDGGFHLKRL